LKTIKETRSSFIPGIIRAALKEMLGLFRKLKNGGFRMSDSKANSPQHHHWRTLRLGFVAIAFCIFGALPSYAQAAQAPANANPRLSIYGFAMLDTGFQFKQSHPDWFDVIRTTKLPAFDDEFGEDGHWFSGVRQSRLGFKGYIPSDLGEIKTIFEFELFGTGADAGQTTFRLRHAWGELGQVGAGQYWSAFVDPDIYPNEVEYWGPPGMVWYRNVQLRWTPWTDGNSRFVVAAERPGASGDQGAYADRIELTGIQARFPMPDISSHYRMARDWGHVQLSGIVRKIYWDDTLDDGIDLSGNDTGWGVSLSSNVKIAQDVVRLQAVYGEGIQNYMNDAPVDVGIVNNFADPTRPLLGTALPVLGVVAFLDHTWNEKFTSTIGYSRIDIDNSSGQAASAFKTGQYAVTNLLYYPVKDVLMGGEFQWGRRTNNTDGFSANDYRIQLSFKYNFTAEMR
jgi:hypothetical protein